MSSIRIFESLDQWRRFRRELKGNLGFVPTMGALHAGHASLFERSVGDNDFTLASIFVNPTQFNNPEDLAKYPRTLEADLQVLEGQGVAYLLLPRYEELYADNYAFQLSENGSSESKLCGASRPGHFRGVLTVVLKLLNLARADRAYFGEKDYQQLDLIRRMAAAFFLETEIIGCPTVRAASGLALSSRNARLSANGLNVAASFAQALARASHLADLRLELASLPLEVDYVTDLGDRRYAAVVVDGVRLIDNVALPLGGDNIPLPASGASVAPTNGDEKRSEL